MALKRGEDMKWTFKVLSAMDNVRESTFLKKADDESIQALLSAMAKEDGKEVDMPEEGRVFSAVMKQREAEEDNKLFVEFEGKFDMADLVSEDGMRKLFDVREGDAAGETFPVMSNI